VAILIQPLVALAFPVFLASTPRGGRILFTVRCSLLSAFLVGVAVLGNPADAYRALVQQPTPPLLNHPTPWVAIAPHLHIHSIYNQSSAVTLERGPHLHGVHTVTQPIVQVSGGAGRTIYLVLALLLGLYVWLRPQDPVRLLWLAGLVLAARCFFEAVMTPYYLAPPLFLLLVLAARTDVRRLAGSIVVALGISWYAYWHFAPWVWWSPIVAGLVVILALTYPGSGRRPAGEVVAETDGSGHVPEGVGRSVPPPGPGDHVLVDT
jgi:hypothetical protein